MKFVITLIIVSVSYHLDAQDTIKIKNPSFEGEAHMGGSLNRHNGVQYWNFRDEGNFEFTKGGQIFVDGWASLASHKGYSPVDVHSAENNFWNVNTKPLDGKNFIGMVTRYDNSYESVYQKLEKSLLKDSSYQFSIHLCISKSYASPTLQNQKEKTLFNKPIHLSIWGVSIDKEEWELLAVSPLIANTDWKKYSFTIKPENNVEVLILQATFHDTKGEPYCGNVLLDKMSDIIMLHNTNTE